MYVIYISLDGTITYAGTPPDSVATGLSAGGQSSSSLLRRKNIDVSGDVFITDWHRCVKQLTVSSKESQAYQLLDGRGGYWQSSGSQGKVKSPNLLPPSY